MDIRKAIEASVDVKRNILAQSDLLERVEEVAGKMAAVFQRGGKVLLCGNGGSAADAQHIAAELSGRFYKDRRPLYAEALHVNTSYITAVANDYSFDDIYSRMVEAAGRSGDMLIGLSTSGNSENVLRALEVAKSTGMETVALTGSGGGRMHGMVDILINIPADDTPRIQEAHILIGHILCQWVEEKLFPENEDQ